MLDRILPAYIKTIAGVTSSAIGTQVYRHRTPQKIDFPFITVGDGYNIDIGQTAIENLGREVGTFDITVASAKSLAEIDSAVDALVNALKAFKGDYIPNDSTLPRMWVQCFLVLDRRSFSINPKGGEGVPYVGYKISVRAAYDTPVTS